MATSGQQCNRCFRGRWVTRGIRSGTIVHVRFLKCDFCGRCDKEICQPASIKRRNVKSAAYIDGQDNLR